MQYLLELYDKDENGFKEVLTKTYAQFEVLPFRIRDYLHSNDLSNLKLFCHKMANSALLVGAKKMQNHLFDLEEIIDSPSLSRKEIEDKIRLIEKVLPDELQSIRVYLQFYL